MLPKKVHKYNALTSVGFACSGLKEAFASEPNILWQLLIAVVAIGASAFFDLWLFIPFHILFAGMVISTEILNTAFEYLCDLIEPKYSEKVKSIKDIAAGAVFFASLSWLIFILIQLALIIF